MILPEKKVTWDTILKDYKTNQKYAIDIFEYDKELQKAIFIVAFIHYYEMLRIKRGFEKVHIYFAQELITEANKTAEQKKIEKFYLDTMKRLNES